MYIKDMVKKKAPSSEQTPTAASENPIQFEQDPVFVDAVEEATELSESDTTAAPIPAIPQDDNMNALAKYSALDAIQAKNDVFKSPSKKKSNKIAARRRR